MSNEADPDQKCVDLGSVQRSIFWGFRIDRRWDDRNVSMLEKSGDKAEVREDESATVRQIRFQEVPALLGVPVRSLRADVTTPDHSSSLLTQRTRQADCLRVVQDHHITLVDPVGQGRGVCVNDCLVVGGFVPSQPAVVTSRPMETIVEALGDLEESLVTPDHDPSGVDTAPDGVSDEHAQHLCDPAPNRRRTDIPGSAVTQGSSYVVRRRRGGRPDAQIRSGEKGAGGKERAPRPLEEPPSPYIAPASPGGTKRGEIGHPNRGPATDSDSEAWPPILLQLHRIRRRSVSVTCEEAPGGVARVSLLDAVTGWTITRPVSS